MRKTRWWCAAVMLGLAGVGYWWMRARPLHACAQAEHPYMLRLSLAAGAVPDALDGQGWTPLAYAARKGRTEAAGLLLSAGASPTGSPCARPLHIAAWNGHAELCRMLLDAGAPVDIREPAVQWGALRVEWDMTALGLASLYGRGDCVRVLLAYGADPSLTGPRGATALHDAAHADAPDCIGLLIDSGTPVDARDGEGHTPLHLAVDEGHTDAVAARMSAGAAISAVDARGHTPLDLAREAGHSDVAQLLLEHGAKTGAELRGESED